MDLHYQSVKTASVVIEQVLPALLDAHAEVWVVTGTGHHTDRASHQQHAKGGVLHNAVREYFEYDGRYELQAVRARRVQRRVMAFPLL